MITHERLKELIEQESGCYVLNDYSIGYIHLKPKYEPETYVNGLEDYILYIYCNDKKEYKEEIFSEQLFETEEEAEWAKEFGDITRTEKLVLPTWEDFDEQKFVWFVDKKQNVCCLHYVHFANKIFINVSGEVIEIGDITKENYTLACRKAKELFLGEE